mmetsp:Transcript_35955/g.103340  ORF Transcript_35955/g.103340 Transcript_35955/m.103340 type:complete len:385 (-) Transcript_35955:434-1588(-)
MSGGKGPSKPGYLAQALRTRSLRPGGRCGSQSSSSASLGAGARLRELEPLRAPAPCWGRFAGSGLGFALGCFVRVLKDFRKESISSLPFPSVTRFRSSQAFLSWASGSISHRSTCRSRERIARTNALSASAGIGMPRLSHSARRSSSPIVSQLKSCFNCTSSSSLSVHESTARPRFEHSALRSLAERPSQRLTSKRLCSTCSLLVPPKMPRRSASALRSSSDHLFQRSSSGRASSAARCASADLASAMMSKERPLRYSESCRILPCSVRSATLRQEPRCERRTTTFFRSQTVALPGTVIMRSICVFAWRSVTCTGCASSSSVSSSGRCSACSSKTLRRDPYFDASSRAERPPEPQRHMSAPRSSRSRHRSPSPSIAASMRGVVS